MRGRAPGRASLRRQLLAGLLLPVMAVIAVNTVVLYRQALQAADTAYDRTLLATAKSIGELLEVVGPAGATEVRATVPYSALEAFEADSRSRMFYRVLGFRGENVSGFDDLPPARRELPARTVYAALVHFYDDVYRGGPVRVAVLLQPVAGAQGQGMATVQVAETLELRRTLARQLLVDTLWRQAALVGLIAVVVVLVVQRATRPVRALSDTMLARPTGDLTPIATTQTPRELLPLVDATNQVMQRLDRLLAHQKRFVRDASHQLRTPLAVLKTQVQSARRGDVEPAQALAEIAHTVDRATELANQMLALAKVEQLHQEGLLEGRPITRWDVVARDVALDLAPLMADGGLDFSLSTVPAPVQAHAWALRELVRNLLHNAIKQSPPGAPLALRMDSDGRHVALTIADHGPGIDAARRERLFQPFSAHPPQADLRGGSGLGLAICHEIVESLGGTLELNNRVAGGRATGLDAVVRLPLAA
jgi:two-component system, OmpR family, sensor histidine kinase TctE